MTPGEVLDKSASARSALRRTDLLAAAALSLFAIFCLSWLIPNFTSPAESELDLAPGFMPALAIWTCLALAIMLIGKTLMQTRQPDSQSPDEEFGDEASGVGLREWLNLGQWVPLSLLTMGLLKSVGFEAAGFFVIAALMLYTRLRNYWVIGLTAGLLPPILSYLIRWVFGIEVP